MSFAELFTENARKDMRLFVRRAIQSGFLDAVEVVRCKDCVNRGIEGECPLYESAYITGTVEGSNFYCAWGERREDG